MAYGYYDDHGAFVPCPTRRDAANVVNMLNRDAVRKGGTPTHAVVKS